MVSLNVDSVSSGVVIFVQIVNAYEVIKLVDALTGWCESSILILQGF